MSAYETIFYGMPYVSCILAGVGILSLTLQKRAILARSILFSFQFWIAPLFYFTYMAIVQRTSTVAVIAGCLELLFLAIYQVLFRRLFVAVTAISPQRLSGMLTYLKVGTWILVALTVPLYLQSGAGIFSEGSRNEFLVGSRLNLYLDYASGLVQVVMTPVVAAIINAERRWRGSVVLYLVLVSAASVLSASKGGAVLSLLAIISLLKFERARDFLRVLLVPICGAAVALSVTVYFVGEFLSLEPSEMVSLMFSRLFLTNDCRALAIDWSRYLGDNGTSVFRESFRLYAGLLGNAPKLPPLGQLLYALQHGTVGMVGANTSSTALLIAYGSDIGKSFFVLLLAGISLGIWLLADIPCRWDVPRLAICISLLSLLSQDFLAFQVCVNILVLLFVANLIKTMLAGILRGSLLAKGNGTGTPMILPR
jgi:hypothetical protein